jgi:carboxylesterase
MSPIDRAIAERIQSMPIMPGAEAYDHDGGPTGVLLCHGFTGSPQSLRPWAEYLAKAGLTVSLPRLPGHGTTWQEMARTRWEDWFAEVDRAFDELQQRCDEIFVMGLSMGGCLALRLGQIRGPAVRGLVLVNPSLTADNKALFAVAPALRLVIRSVKGIASDIKNPEVREVGYERTPTKAAATLPGLWRSTQQHLSDLTQPVLAYHSKDDHVVGPASLRLLAGALRPGQLEVRELSDSYHVATLDNDAAAIFAGSLEFVRVHSQIKRESTSDASRESTSRE